jgi:site-specific recombinase XerD
MSKRGSDSLTVDEVRAVLRAAGEGRHGVRDHAMLLTLYHHGLRVSELCRLTLADLDLEGRRIWIERLNRGRSGAHPVPADEARALEGYLKARRAEGTLSIPALFVNERRAPLTRNAVYYLVRRAGEAAGLDRPLYPHLLRRAAGCKLVGEGHDVRLVQDYLGLRTARSVLRFVPEPPPEVEKVERFTGLWREAREG